MTKFKLKDQIQENKLLTSFSIFFVIVFVFLGVWQIERAAHKEGLLQAFNAEQESPPIRLTSQSPDWSRVFVDGIFDSSRQILIDNQIHKGKVGYKIFTPFRFDDNKIVLVDRGWIAQGQSRSDLPQLNILEKKSRIIATVTSPEQGVLAGSELLTNEWPRVSQTKAVEVIASAFKEPILDIVLVLDPGSSQITEFIQIKPFAITPVKHYGYAMQWFTMSIVLLGMFLYALKREK
ncbi:MAG: SURF1 family protein [Gammaproteobacteria bacterium]|jgi:surfeit locus 1 family protein|nr:SURF1 family protein [Gammaproteobacteria bacterium]MDB0028512.1 SURF1 family protein [bacterium]MDA9785856.1 SURF1 family protein [Gammaproteobacteria bacterium]MDA9971232.1 SURF1 family protein [Gammaproteobacteria bacterium]MDB4183564.1 SURF1 family protein [Gammaproteobacteria bacterium]|tara:strand:- start:1136 stop:1840 length:705 start_codon:yes stop_codon:yes gene_type:complete